MGPAAGLHKPHGNREVNKVKALKSFLVSSSEEGQAKFQVSFPARVKTINKTFLSIKITITKLFKV